MNDSHKVIQTLNYVVYAMRRLLEALEEILCRFRRGEPLDNADLARLMGPDEQMLPPEPTADRVGEYLESQLASIRACNFRSNSIVEIGHSNGDFWMRVNGLHADLNRTRYLVIECLACSAQDDPFACVTAKQLMQYVEERMPAGFNWAPESLHKAIHYLRKRCDAIENAPRYAGGWRLSTPNVLNRDGQNR